MEPLIKLDDDDDDGNGGGVDVNDHGYVVDYDSDEDNAQPTGSLIRNGPGIVKNLFSPSSSSASSHADDETNWNVENATKHLDDMIQFLDCQLESSSYPLAQSNKSVPSTQKDPPLPEFVARGGSIFDPPHRVAVHPFRPPPLEFFPRPLRESQLGCSLRFLAVSDSHICAGREDGSILFWRFSELPNTPHSLSHPSVPSPITVMLSDSISGVFWSGHEDGRIRCWSPSVDFQESLCWVAHRGPVLSMVISTYGDLWSGSEGGALKIWPWEALNKFFSSPLGEIHKAAHSIEWSSIDLRAQVTLNVIPNALTSDVKYLVSDHCVAKVWSASVLSFALWDARSHDLLKVFNVDGQIERMDPITGQDVYAEDDAKIKLSTGTKKERSPSSLGFFQRSRNAIIGAAEVVRRVATKGYFGDDNRRTEALIMTPDGMIWSGCTSGVIVQWDGNGNRLQDFQYHDFAVQCFLSFGSRLWVGYASGTVQVLNLEGNLLGEWVAHDNFVVNMVYGHGYVFSLAGDGGIRGWNSVFPGPLDGIMRSLLTEREPSYTRIENVQVLAGTWNVAEGRASLDSLVSWLGSAVEDVDIVVVGLQEVEMGAGVFAMSAAKESVGLEGSSVGQWWLDIVGKTLSEGSLFERVGSRQLAGLLIASWVRNDLKEFVGDVDVAAVPCGFGRAIGNKGAVGLRFRVYGQTMCFVNCHFAAHLEGVNRRNSDFEHVYYTMSFGRASNVSSAAAGIVPYLTLSSLFACSTFLFWLVYRCGLPLLISIAAGATAFQMFRGPNAIGANSCEGVPELSQADMIIFLGDFNYRLDGVSYDEAKDFISQRSFDWLKERDQLRAEMQAGAVFQGMREAIIRFPPTYKFDKYQPGLSGYDSGEKKRVPAWCDRIIYRDSSLSRQTECSLSCPIVASVSDYDSCMDVTDSDHKPVRCIFNVRIARVDESRRRQEFADIVKSEEVRTVIENSCTVPDSIVSTNSVILQNRDTTALRITNKSNEDELLFQIICVGESFINENVSVSDYYPRRSFGFPRWLQVTPAVGAVKPYHVAEVMIRIEDSPAQEESVNGVGQNPFEENIDEEVILVVKVRGACSTSESKDHRVTVRFCRSPHFLRGQSKSNDSDKVRDNLLRRSDFQDLLSSHHAIDNLRNMRLL